MEAAGFDSEERFHLEEKSLSYAWLAQPLKKAQGSALWPPTSTSMASAMEMGAHEGHKGGMNVLMTDGSIRFVKRAISPRRRYCPRGSQDNHHRGRRKSEA